MAHVSEQTALAEVRERLTSTYTGVPPDRISAAIQQAHQRFEQSPIRDFVPLLVERRARNELAGAGDQAAAPGQ